MNGTVAPSSSSATAAFTCQVCAFSSPAMRVTICWAVSGSVTLRSPAHVLLGLCLISRGGVDDHDRHAQAPGGDLVEDGPAGFRDVAERPAGKCGERGQS